ncbi:hypothetical protein [Actinomycetospora termitidis]|uniref:Lipoprotein n=1 Tax=Actinomycetospora termitidis TaxID=3053470 RepID=A0ABT7M639_9PSEU|nr:hypothetical protein [Actinomycetospora sp. Odt1-22]MDL5155714.1 hypothetical protein [Actinomycetospora sp. Odt1-22]
MTRRLLPVLLLAVLAGCGTGLPVSPVTTVRAAIVATAAAGPSRVTVAGETAAAGQRIPLQGSGVLDPAGQAADLDLQVPSLGDVRVVFSGGRLDAQLPPAAAGLIGMLAGGKQWVSVDVERLARSSYGASLGALGVGTSQNPARQLAYLGALRDDVREVGPEPVDGKPATHYAGVVDLDRVPGAQDPATRPALDRLKAQLGTSTLPVDLWLTPDGTLAKVAQTVTVPPQPGAPTGPTSATTSLTFTQVGGAPAVVPPPAEEVADLSALLPAG